MSIFDDIRFEAPGLVITARREALLEITSDKVPGCKFWYDEGLTSARLVQLIEAKFGADSDEAFDAGNAPLVITYADGNVEYVMDARTAVSQAAYIGYTIGRYAAVHAVPHGRVMLLLVQMHHQLENERHCRT